MEEAAILALIQAVPAIYSTVQTFIANNQIKDVATMKAALAAAQSAGQADFTQLLADLGQPDPG